MTTHTNGDERTMLESLAAADSARESTSDVLSRFRRHLPSPRVTLADMMDALEDRSIGTILLLLAIPTVSPIPLGLSALFNLPVLLFCLQLAVGRGDAGLPKWLLRRSVDHGTAVSMIDAVLPRVKSIEAMLKPRFSRFADIDRQRWFGLLCLVLAVIAFVPLPLMGWLPGFALVFLSLGLIERDGVAVVISLAFAVGAVIVAALIVSGMFYAGHEFLDNGPFR